MAWVRCDLTSETLPQAADVAAPYVRRGVTAATPYVKATAEAAQDIAKPVIKAAGPVFQASHFTILGLPILHTARSTSLYQFSILYSACLWIG